MLASAGTHGHPHAVSHSIRKALSLSSSEYLFLQAEIMSGWT